MVSFSFFPSTLYQPPKSANMYDYFQGDNQLILNLFLNRLNLFFFFNYSVFSCIIKIITAGVQPRQDPGDTLRMNGVVREREREREKTRETILDRAKSVRGRERERQRERERVTRRGMHQSLAESGNALFFTVAFIP